MHQKMQENLTSGIVSVLLELAEEGVRQGLFNIKYPAETIEMLVLYSNIAFDDYHEKNSPSMEKKIAAFLYNTEKLLGAREGSLQKVLRKLFQ